MDNSTTDQLKGAYKEAKGAVKEKVGEVTNDPNLADEGRADNLEGKVQKKVGQVERVFEK